jgi:hypothetical protein
MGLEDDFVRYVEKCRKSKLPDIIENTSRTHAGVLIKNILIYAADSKDDVKIVSGCFLEDVYKDLANDAKVIMDSGNKIDAITMCDAKELKCNPFYQTIANHKNGIVRGLGRPVDDGIHFIVTGSAYRVEVDDHVKKAFASFNDNDGIITRALNREFKELSGAQGERKRDVQPRLVGAD